jgi:hypothetical protein
VVKEAGTIEAQPYGSGHTTDSHDSHPQNMLMAPPSGTSAHNAAFGGCNSGLYESKPLVEDVFGSPNSTLFLVDYDDTVLSSSWLAQKGLSLKSHHIPLEVAHELAVLEKHAIQLLTCVLNKGKVALVTNAETGWIELSARKFLPGLYPLLEKTRIVSARSTFEKQFPKQTQQWKNAAYELVFQETFEGSVQLGFKGRFNVLSLGDSLYERNALMHLSKSLPDQVLGKSIKLIERPTIEQLQRQLEILNGHLDDLTHAQEPIDLMLTVEYISEC